MEETTVQEEAQQLPPVDFISYLANLVETGRLYLEGIPNPETNEVVTNFPLVKHIIDTIEMLEEKTKGNLTAPEANFLANTLYELRMGYVRAISRQEAATEEETATGETEETEEEASTDNTENAS
ncbi:MAG: DUF1844 domain-containing protein [Candidatus Poribacteria bacterium]|nr:DUF1844 domain-containing protein [Candidatus Poribacteria bacterium]MDE0325649.1 DUF1844 domain-containing protein [Candidatus Poribacteria bacterium]